MFIYIIKNKVNDKLYIGQTTKSIEHRFKQHCKKSKTYISRAIQKHGKENFYIEQIDVAKSQEELNEKEIYWINFYSSVVPNGYNIDLGGNGKGKIMNPATIEKLRNANLGRIHSDEFREKCRKRMLGTSYAKDTVWTDDKRKNLAIGSANSKPAGSIQYRGVSFHKGQGKYQVKFEYMSESLCLGFFFLLENAKRIYDIVAHIKRPGIGYFNVPDETIEVLINNLTEKPSKIVDKLIKELYPDKKYEYYEKHMETVRNEAAAKRGPRGNIPYKGVCAKNDKYVMQFTLYGEKKIMQTVKDAKNGGMIYDIVAKIKRPNFGYFNFPNKSIQELLSDLTEEPSTEIKQLIEEYKNGA